MTLPLLTDEQIEEIVAMFGRKLTLHPTLHSFYGEDTDKVLRETLKGTTRDQTVVITLHGVLDELSLDDVIKEVVDELNEADRLSWMSASAPQTPGSPTRDPSFYQPIKYGDLRNARTDPNPSSQ